MVTKRCHLDPGFYKIHGGGGGGKKSCFLWLLSNPTFSEGVMLEFLQLLSLILLKQMQPFPLLRADFIPAFNFWAPF